MDRTDEKNLSSGEVIIPMKQDESADSEKGTNATAATTIVTTSTAKAAAVSPLSEMCSEFHQIKEQHTLHFVARYEGIRQMTVCIIVVLVVVEIIGITYFMNQGGYTLSEATLFAHYTMTSAGYGNYPIPKTVPYQIFLIVYMFVGIAIITVVVAQVYQYFSLEATMMQHRFEKYNNNKQIVVNDSENPSHPIELKNEYGPYMVQWGSSETKDGQKFNATNVEVLSQQQKLGATPSLIHLLYIGITKTKQFCCGANEKWANILMVVGILLGLLGLGTFVLMGLEGWTFAQALYFSTFTMTTVGYGDFSPTTNASTWFVIVWLPTNIAFLSIFWGNIVNMYAAISEWSVKRHKKQIQHRIQNIKNDQARQEKQQYEKLSERRSAYYSNTAKGVGNSENAPSVLPAPSVVTNGIRGVSTDGGSELRASNTIFSSFRNVEQDRGMSLRSISADKEGAAQVEVTKSILPVDGGSFRASCTATKMKRMKDVIVFVRQNIMVQGKADTSCPLASKFLTFESTSKSSLPFHENGARIPSFVLLVLVQERIAHIIADVINGVKSREDDGKGIASESEHQVDSSILDAPCHPRIEVMEISVGIKFEGNFSEKMKYWRLPHGVRKAFVATCFEALLHVGEYPIKTKSAEALFELNPMDFHQLMSPLLAAFGDAGTMEGWLAQTECLIGL